MILLPQQLQHATILYVSIMLRRSLLILSLLGSLWQSAFATDTTFIRSQIKQLCKPEMGGRGYVHRGQENAAVYIAGLYRSLGLQPLSPDSSYYQSFYFNVNTFPGTVALKLNRKKLQPGTDFLVDAASAGKNFQKVRVVEKDLGLLKDSTDWNRLRKEMGSNMQNAYLLIGADSFASRFKMPVRRMGRQLPAGIYLVPNSQKPIWTVARDTVPATVFYLADSVVPKKLKKVSATVEQELLLDNPARNVIGFVPGTEVPDSFIVFCAHYDHIGRMGDAVFTGANDNASGTSFMLALAKWYAANPQRYSIAFMAFAGEEAGLLGSKYYVNNPLFPLNSIRFLINIDMMADATKGITAVNATEFPDAYESLKSINEKHSYLPDVVSRGKSANSDHHYFAEAQVPCFFFYGNGGPGFYHDVHDQPETISLKNVDGVLKLVKDFVSTLQ